VQIHYDLSPGGSSENVSLEEILQAKGSAELPLIDIAKSYID